MVFREPRPSPSYDPAGPRRSGESHWVNLRWRRIPAWFAVVLVAAAIAVAVSVQMVREAGQPYIGASEITGGVVFLVGSLVVAVWVLYDAPRVFTRQGVMVDADGITLVQESNLWFTGRTAHIPWDMVHSVSEDIVSGANDRRKKHAIVTVLLHVVDPGTRVPSWAHNVSGPQIGLPAGGGPQTRVTIRPGNRWQPSIVHAIRATRPNLFS